MPQRYTSSWKVCATCAYWLGQRDCDTFNQQAEIWNSGCQGRCAIPSGGWRGYQRQASASCNDWMKWPVLK